MLHSLIYCGTVGASQGNCNDVCCFTVRLCFLREIGKCLSLDIIRFFDCMRPVTEICYAIISGMFALASSSNFKHGFIVMHN